MSVPSHNFRNLLPLSIVAGILYSSWPLGYILNPTVAQHGLASGLEGIGQPFNWLFIGIDVAASLLIIVVCFLLWQQLRQSQRRQVLMAVLIFVGLFAIGTIVDGVLPIRCEPSVQQCPSFTQDHLLLTHGLFSIGASVLLFAGVVVQWWQRRRDRLLCGLIIGYVLFGLFSFIDLFIPGQGNWSQHYYIVLCSISLALLPYTINQAAKTTA